jgi:hypothetical protein
MTEGDTRDSEAASSDRRAGVAKRPRASQESSAIGGRRIDDFRPVLELLKLDGYYLFQGEIIKPSLGKRSPQC